VKKDAKNLISGIFFHMDTAINKGFLTLLVSRLNVSTARRNYCSECRTYYDRRAIVYKKKMIARDLTKALISVVHIGLQCESACIVDKRMSPFGRVVPEKSSFLCLGKATSVPHCQSSYQMQRMSNTLDKP
jgi:hypothetical protein